MAQTRVTREQAQQAKDAYLKAHGVKVYAAQALGLHPATYNNRLRACRHYQIEVSAPYKKEPTYGTPEERNLLDDLKQQLKTLTDTNKHLAEQVGTADKIKDLIHEVRGYAPKPPRWVGAAPSKGSTGTPVLVCSDWHYGETVKACQLNGVNAFNEGIAKKRIERLFAKTVELLFVHMSASAKYDQIVVPLLGDMLSGSIHEELAETNWEPPTLSVINLSNLLIGGFDLLLKHFPRVLVPCVVGNHGRLHKKPRYKNKQWESFEFLLYHFLARHYRGDDRICFTISDSTNLELSIYNTRLLLNHGDDFRGGGGISGSWSPILRGDFKKRKQSMAINRPYDLMLIGHWHTLQRLEGVRVNGCLKGFDEYALMNGYAYQLPIQDLFVIHPLYGVTCEWQVYLEQPGTTFDLRTDQPILPKH